MPTWYGHVMRKNNEDMVENVEAEMVENVEAEMAELAIYRDDIHDRQNWRNIVMKRNVNPHRKTDYKPIIIILYLYSAIGSAFDFNFERLQV